MRIFQVHAGAAPSYLGGSLLKVRSVIAAGLANEKVASALKQNVGDTLRDLGVELTAQEIAAVEDVVHGRSESDLSEISSRFKVDEMNSLRRLWKEA
jgi:hypothetical protein